jgi:hypothetical protein
MGKVRGWTYDAVIGIGGRGPEPRAHGIAGKVNWVGIGPKKSKAIGKSFRGPVVTFDHFLLMENRGPVLAAIAPALAQHMYNVNRRVVLLDESSGETYSQALEILEMAKDEPASTAAQTSSSGRRKSCNERCA